MRSLVESDPIVLVEIAGAIAEEGRMPPEAITHVAVEHAARLAEADKTRLRLAMEQMLMGHDVDAALEWMHQGGLLRVLVPELEATVDLVQETGRQHKDVWAHTKQVVKQTVRRPLVRWAASSSCARAQLTTSRCATVNSHAPSRVSSRSAVAVRASRRNVSCSRSSATSRSRVIRTR
ncbi:MAG TPA: hypothetical protein VLT45_13720 [Kofleriaceae bacterium]|nr:hypothetical protein [Kofleriaceae bacterium]